MDSTEDLSARVLLKHFLNVETTRTPLTRSVAVVSTAPRRSRRLNKHDSGALTPQAMLRRSLGHKMRESISSKTLPSKRRTASTVLKQTPGPASLILDDGDTPRQIFKNILLTEPVKSPVVNEHVESQEQQPQQPSPDSSLQSRRHSIELSGLELSDLTIGNVETTIKRLDRKRPHRSLNVTAFEKRLKGAHDLAEEVSLDDHSSLSLSSSTSLSLKTPFIDARTERKALQRKGVNRRKVSEEDFGAAVEKREMGNSHGMSMSAPGQVLSETVYSEGFTLGLSKISEPDITTDIVNFNTALYSQTDGMSNYSTLATQDKPTVVASQIQRDLREQLVGNEQQYSFPMEENTMREAQERSLSISTRIDNATKDAVAPCQSEQEKSVVNLTFDVADPEGNVDNSERVEADIQTPNQGGHDDDKKEEHATKRQSHQEALLSLTLEKEGTKSQINEDEGEVEGMNEEELQEEEGETENEKEKIEEEEKKDETAEKRGDEVEEEEGGEEVLKQIEADMTGAEEGKDEVDNATGDSEYDKVVEADSQEDEDGNSECITQRAVCAEDELIMPIQNTDADLPDDTKPEYYDEPSIQEDGAEIETDTSENKENTLQESGSPEVVEQVEQSEEEPMEEEEEEEDEEDEEDDDFPGKTPAFVKQKRNFFHFDAQASPFAPKNIQPSDACSGPKSKQKAQRKPRSPKSDPGLPKSYLMQVFKHFAKTKVSADVYPVLKDVMDKFLDRVAKDLEAYALHARRSTIGAADCELLLRRQGHVNDKVPVEVLIEKHLRMDQRKLLIPIATSGNVVFPKKR